MRKIIALAMLVACNALAQTNPPDPTVKGGVQDIVDAIKGTKTNWVFEVHGLYAPDLGERYGAGLGAFYAVNDYLFTGLRLDWVDGGFVMPSGSAGLQVPIKLTRWLTLRPFGYGGIGLPLSGSSVGGFIVPGRVKNPSGDPIAITGLGVAVDLVAGKSWNLNLIADREQWAGYAGQQYRFGLMLNKRF